jgi:hypothetical protein
LDGTSNPSPLRRKDILGYRWKGLGTGGVNGIGRQVDVCWSARFGSINPDVPGLFVIAGVFGWAWIIQDMEMCLNGFCRAHTEDDVHACVLCRLVLTKNTCVYRTLMHPYIRPYFPAYALIQ